jgi:hypothetical protein
MAFLQPAQLEALVIEKMVFHVVGPEDGELTLLEEIDPGPFSTFFLDRLRSSNNGIMFDFIPGSSVLASFLQVENDPELFVDESKKLAALFKTQHGHNTSKGVFLMFLLSANAERFYALVKYDHQVVLSYTIEDRADAHYALLQQLQDTFVKSPEALQKSAIARLKQATGELCVRDRVSPKEVTQYFKAFLGAQRRHTPGSLTAKIAEITLKVAKEHSKELSADSRKNVRQRLYDTLQAHAGFESDDADSFLTSVFGPLTENSRIKQAFERNLRNSHLEGESFEFDRDAVKRPAKRRIVTKEGIQVILDRQYDDSVKVQGLAGGRARITITTAGVEEDDDFAERNPR